MSNLALMQAHSGALQKRLYDLKTTYTEVEPDSLIRPFVDVAFQLYPLDALKEIQVLLVKIKELADSVDKAAALYCYDVPGSNPIPYTPAEQDRAREQILTELNRYTDALQSLQDELGRTATVDQDRKIDTQFSVEELAYFFRLLWDTKQVTANSQKDLYKRIKMNFTTKEAKDISLNSIKNNFERPPDSTIDEMVDILYRLQYLAQQNQKNGIKNKPVKKKK